jgi:ribosome-associated toxin RatA of RatAB toxin-antitoxin module
MGFHIRNAWLPYPRAFLRELVLDVERYPDFIEGCHAIELLSRHETMVWARVTTSYGFSFVSKVVWSLFDISIDSPTFKGHWTFKDEGKGTHVTFAITLVHPSFAQKRFFQWMFPLASKKIFYSFTQRAHILYTEENQR